MGYYLPIVHWGAPHVYLALLLGSGNCTGDSEGLDATVEYMPVGDGVVCWLGLACGSNEVSVSKNTLSDA